MRIEPRLLPDTLPFLGDLPPLLTRLYAARGVASEAELDKSLARLIPYQQLKGIDAAVDLLVTALDERQRMLIVGDLMPTVQRPVLSVCLGCACWEPSMSTIWCRTVSSTATA